MIKYLNKDNFLKEVSNEKVVLVDFYADWCGPCQAIHPILEELSDEFDGLAVVAKVDVDQEPGLAGVFNVRSIPTIIMFKKGEPVDILVGLQSKAELQKRIKNPLQRLNH